MNVKNIASQNQRDGIYRVGILRLVYIGVFTSMKTLAFWPQFLCLSSWMYMTAMVSKSINLGIPWDVAV